MLFEYNVSRGTSAQSAQSVKYLYVVNQVSLCISMWCFIGTHMYLHSPAQIQHRLNCHPNDNL